MTSKKVGGDTMDFVQMLDHLSIGTAVLDEDLNVVFWNRWLMEHSLISREEAMGVPVYELFPELVKKGFTTKARNVLKTGKPAFFARTKQQYVFPFPTVRSFVDESAFPKMYQTVILSPLHDEDQIPRQILVSVFDVTDWVVYQNQLLKSKEELEKLSMIDDLTQIPNRRCILERIRIELARHNRKKRSMSLVMIDIDHFKKVNDTYGHICGDLVLKEMAQIFLDGLRVYDVLGRYGGEEFIMLLPETTLVQAVMVSERLRIAVEEKVFICDRRNFHLTISLGIAFMDGTENLSVDDLIRIADGNLYLAKKAGRNRVAASD